MLGITLTWIIDKLCKFSIHQSYVKCHWIYDIHLEYVTQWSVCMICMLCIALSDIWQCEIIALPLTDILFMSYFVFISCTNFNPCGLSIHILHSIPQPHHNPSPLGSAFGVTFLLYTGNSIHWKLCWVWSVWTLICTLYSQPYWAGYIKADIFGTDQIWQSYISKTTIPHSAEDNCEDDWLKSMF